MGQWSKGKVLPENINGNQEFTTNDNLALTELNAIVNNSFYASDVADNAMGKAQEAVKTAQEAVDAVVLGEGTKVTLGGVSQATWSADFAEAEREKSKNLFNMYEKPYVANCNVSVNGNTISLTATGDNTAVFVYSIFGLEVGKKYTVSVKSISYVNSMGLFIGDSAHQDKSEYGVINTSNKVLTFTATQSTLYIKGYASYDSGNTMTIEELQLEKGEVKTDYQSYDGSIVHENDLRKKTMVLVGQVYLNFDDCNNITFENIECKDGDIFRLIVSGSTQVATDGKVYVDGITSGYSGTLLQAYPGSNDVTSSTDSFIPIRCSELGFFVDMIFGVTIHYGGSFAWFNSMNSSVDLDSTTNYWKHYEGFLVQRDDVKTITINAGANFYRGTTAKLYKMGRTI